MCASAAGARIASQQWPEVLGLEEFGDLRKNGEKLVAIVKVVEEPLAEFAEGKFLNDLEDTFLYNEGVVVYGL